MIKLHRCPSMWMKIPGHPCWRVQKALDDQGIQYELVKAPHRRGKRTRVTELTGQSKLPVIELDDGTAYREESKQMEERIRSGKLQSS
jgi:glutathione S-transferase